ncbi:prepilin-type N-terminal cleavage/methylation domain-containing protein [Grimontia kaedaensis]|uniref:Prepilin-type N-terminal cleavage/methylation domain-containing protein n=1 Tax=Grimontia kaedaensis TaxID=2872157 RepID=A0ABY4WWZ8_9GAMM|nr:prepilin-type N-terminal cleavage/methylation domain-containing protein [Grimontia kaedaensis]USH03022.1 prepilin-type N-terminal cleavage/methylation domain-containing protein [Grimontia kaedaensis]
MKRSFGYTLVEMMVGMTVSLIVLASALAIFTVNTEFGTKQLQNDFLRSQLNIIADTMKNEIARAGFCYDCSSVNPFIRPDGAGASSSILIDDSASKVEDGECIRFAYNHDKRSGAMALDKDDAKGYRLGKDSRNNPVIEIYENWDALANWTCESGYWRDMTFDRLSIESLSFKRSLLQSVGSTNKAQVVEVTITASLKSDSSISDTVNFTVSVPNVDG